MSDIKRTELLDVLTKVARVMCPLMPTHFVGEFGSGKLVGRAEGVAKLFRALLEEEVISEDEHDILTCALQYQDLEELRAHREEVSKMLKEQEEALSSEETE